MLPCLSGIGLHSLPIIVCMLTIMTFTISYILAVTNDHVSPLFPYISDTGTKAPESCIFGQLLNMVAAVATFCFYCWHKHVVEHLSIRYHSPAQIRFSQITLCCGLGSTLGMSIVANFQETLVASIHLTGAAMTFGFGSIYIALVTHITRNFLDPSSRMWIIRLVISLWCVFFFIMQPIFGTLARLRFDGADIRKWKPTDRGYYLHAISSFSEWAMAFAFICFFFTMISELRHYTIKAVKVCYRWTDEEPMVETQMT